MGDGSYEIAVHTVCTASANNLLPGVDEFYSHPIPGIIDQHAPSVFDTIPITYSPGNEISATFSENVDCSMPYVFSAEVDLSFTDQTTNRMMHNSQTIIKSLLLNV